MPTDIQIVKPDLIIEGNDIATPKRAALNFINATVTDDAINNQTNVTIPPSSLTIGTTPIASGVAGRVLFEGAGNVVQEDSSFFWDNANKRLGVGATPATTARLDVRAQGALSTDIAFRVRNSADSGNLFQINGDGSGGFNVDGKVIKFGSGSQITTSATAAASLMNNFGFYGYILQSIFSGNNQVAHGFDHLNIGGSLSTDGTKTLEIANGTAPTSTGADSIKMYADQISGYGTAAPHFRTANGNVIKLYKQDLPTSPTNAQIATFLSNLGLANLI